MITLFRNDPMIITLFNKFEISIGNKQANLSGLPLLLYGSSKYDSHGCLDNVTAKKCPTRNGHLVFQLSVILNQGFQIYRGQNSRFPIDFAGHRYNSAAATAQPVIRPTCPGIR